MLKLTKLAYPRIQGFFFRLNKPRAAKDRKGLYLQHKRACYLSFHRAGIARV